MSNRAYLCASPWRRTDPSHAPTFDPSVHTVAASVARVPLLWLALFRPADLRAGGLPVCAKTRALAQLAAAVPRLDKLFGARGSLAPHAAALATAIRTARGAYIAIELDEIADLYSRRTTFDGQVRAALGLAAPAKRALATLSGLPDRGTFPAVDTAKRKRAEADAIHSLLGTSHIRAVPWEPEAAAAPARAPKLHPGRALRDALAAGDVAAARALLAAGADPSFADAFGSTFEQVIYGKVPVAMFDELVRAGADLNAKQRVRGYPLVQAAWTGNAEPIRALIARGANVHVLDPFGRTPLAIAVREGHVAAVTVLLAEAMSEKELRAAIREGGKSDKGGPAIPLVEAAIARSASSPSP